MIYKQNQNKTDKFCETPIREISFVLEYLTLNVFQIAFLEADVSVLRKNLL